jgi:excinuclease ABC subunit A
MLRSITVHGARQHNLQNIGVEIPRHSLTVVTGLSGSGKSSLAFDTIYAEGQRRYVETLSPYARQFLDQMERPDVDSIDGLSPAISIEQKTTNRSPRSTVGTITEIYDYLRVLYSAIGIPHCPDCGLEIVPQSAEQIAAQILEMRGGERVMILAPVVRGRKGEFKKELEGIAKKGFVRARIDGEMLSLDEEIALDRRRNHTIDVVVDRIVIRDGVRQRLEESIRTALKMADGLVAIAVVSDEKTPERLYSQKLSCPECGASIPKLEPRSFSFNSPYGACEKCHGLGSQWRFDADKVIVDPSKPLLEGALGPGSASAAIIHRVQEAARRNKISLTKPFENLPENARTTLLAGSGPFPGILKLLMDSFEEAAESYREYLFDFMSAAPCIECQGARLKRSHLSVRVKDITIAEFTALGLDRALETARGWKLDARERQIAGRLVARISDGCRTGLPEPAAVRSHPFRRRSAAHPPGHADRLEAPRRAVCAR